MARPLNKLSARGVTERLRAGTKSYHADGGGLYLLVSGAGTGSWVFRYRVAGKLRELGLGAVTDFSLAEARERARAARQLRADGKDPIELKRAVANATVRTWGQAKNEFIETKRDEWKTPAQERQWRQSLDDYAFSDDRPLESIDTDATLDVLRPIWQKGGKVETATRIRGRIERILDAEMAAGRLSLRPNPARLKGHLEHLLPTAGKIKKKTHHPAMPWAQMPEFMIELRSRQGISRSALEFTILTAARTNEVIEMPRTELTTDRWKLPPERMKTGEEHIVPLTAPALAVLARCPGAYPFPLSNNAMLSLLQDDMGKPYTVHGFRSTFMDWARDNAIADEHVIDQALAHKIPDEVKRAYGRSKLFALRVKLMKAWANYLAGKPVKGSTLTGP